MDALRELLAERATRSDAEVLDALPEGLATDPAQSGAAAALHALLQRYFALDEDARTRSFASPLRRHRDTAQALMAMLSEDGETNVVQLMASLLVGRPRPTGALAAALGADGEAASLASKAGAAVKVAFEAFTGTVRKSKGSEAEIELSLAWGAVEGGLLDRVAQHADLLALAHGPALTLGGEVLPAWAASLAAGRTTLAGVFNRCPVGGRSRPSGAVSRLLPCCGNRGASART